MNKYELQRELDQLNISRLVVREENDILFISAKHLSEDEMNILDTKIDQLCQTRGYDWIGVGI